MERPGRAIELLAAEMAAGGRAVLRARAWRIAAGDTARGRGRRGDAAAAAGDGVAAGRTGRPGWLPGFVDSVEWRLLRGWFGDPGRARPGSGSGCRWSTGEEPSPLQRLALVADSANGAAAPLDIRDWLFVNTDLTVHLHRPPVGEWMAVDARTVVGPAGLGTVSGAAVRRARARWPVGAEPGRAAALSRFRGIELGRVARRPTRQVRISEVRIARAPSAARSSMTWLTSCLRTMVRTAEPALLGQRGHRGGLQTGGDRLGLVQHVLRAVVVDHQVLAGVDHPAQPLGEHHLGLLDLDGLLAVRARLALDEGGLRLRDRVAEGSQAVLAQGAPGGHHVGDGVGEAELHGDLHRAVELDDVGADPVAGQVRADQPGVGGGDLLALQVLDLPLARPGVGGAAKRNFEAPNPSSSTPLTWLPDSSIRSAPVMPRCRSPEPT